MPRIPVYQSGVTQAALPGPRMSTGFRPEQFDGGLSGAKGVTDALDKGAKTALTIADQIKKKTEAVWVQERLAKLSQQYDSYIYGTPDGQVQGLLSSKGLAAPEAAKKAPEFLDKALSDLTAEAPSQDALADFRARALSIRASASSTISRHAATELNRYHAEAAAGNVQIQIESIAADPNRHPDDINAAFETRVAPSIKDVAALTGKPADAELRAGKASLVSQVILQNLAQGRVRRAADLLAREDWNEALDAKSRAALTDKVRTETIKLDADDKATQFAARMSGGESYSALMNEINGIEDRDMKVATRGAFRALATQIRYEQREAEQDATFNAYMGVESLAGDLKAQYDYVQSLPPGTKAYKQAQSLYNKYAAAEGRHSMTDPDAFDALSQKIQYGEIGSEKELLSDPAAVKIAGKDMKLLRKDLTDAQTIKTGELREVYLQAQGGSKIKNVQDQLAFYDWARKQVAGTNRAGDPEYAQKLADLWFLKGEKGDGGFFSGYGTNTQFRKAMSDPTWLPNIRDDDDPREGDEMSLTRSAANEIINTVGQPGRVPVEQWNQLLAESGNDPDLAARRVWRRYLFKKINKRSRP